MQRGYVISNFLPRLQFGHFLCYKHYPFLKLSGIRFCYYFTKTINSLRKEVSANYQGMSCFEKLFKIRITVTVNIVLGIFSTDWRSILHVKDVTLKTYSWVRCFMRHRRLTLIHLLKWFANTKFHEKRLNLKVTRIKLSLLRTIAIWSNIFAQ